MAENPMTLDDDDVQTESKQSPEADAQESRLRQGDQNRPYCRRHNCLMVAKGTKGGVTRYSCPVPDCKETEKRPLPNSSISREPKECPACRQRQELELGKGKRPTPVYLVADYAHSESAMLKMICPTPGCGFKMEQPRPDVASRSRRIRSADEVF